jgi:tetratricopeptide (TPR) repeat protein
MASEHDRRVPPGAGSGETARLLDEAAWSDTVSDDDTDSLELLRRVWLACDDGSGTDAILAATSPLAPAQQEQIVQRLLRDSARSRSERPRPPSLSRFLPPTLRRTPLWSVAAAAALCCWMTAIAPRSGDSRGAHGAAARASLSATAIRARVPALPLQREARGTVMGAKAAVAPSAGEDLTELAETYARQQRFDEAEALFQRALTEQERRLGPAHKEVAATLTRLATLYQTQHLYAKAEPLYVRALEIDPPFAVF